MTAMNEAHLHLEKSKKVEKEIFQTFCVIDIHVFRVVFSFQLFSIFYFHFTLIAIAAATIVDV